jgi:hypothetical protein
MKDGVLSGSMPTTPLEDFQNATISTGGDSSLYNLNVFYNVNCPVLSACPHSYADHFHRLVTLRG